ncbi:MAG: hypothetical protein GX062_06510 [Firmicutes bacterium]|nr:hypothetical protein [Bacillota bacterium]
MRKRQVLVSILILGLLTLMLTAGCTTTTPAPSEEPQVGSGPQEGPFPGADVGSLDVKLPETKKDTIQLEGTDEEFDLILFQVDNMGFFTYVPADMIADTVSSAEGDAAVFMTNFLGNKREDVYLSYLLLPEGVTQEEAVAKTKEALTKVGADVKEHYEYSSVYPWAKDQLRFVKEDGDTTYIGYVGFGSRGDRVLQVTTHMPQEFSEGVFPRVNKIMVETRWFTAQ